MKKIVSILMIFTLLLSDLCISVSANKEGKYVYRNSTYDFGFAPEAMHVSDEDFFGEWDSLNGIWIQEPDLNYERFPALKDVEIAAKAGDYAAAKEAIMAYYVPQKDSKVSALSATDAAILEAQMSERNIYAVRTTGDVICFVDGATTEWQELSTTAVLPFVENVVSQKNPYITFAVASVDKSNTPAEIMSRNTENPPTLTIVADGVERTFIACEDTYISPNLNANTNYGDEEFLYAQEYGYTSHWSDPTAPWGDEASATRRSLIKFNVTEISPSAKVTSAVFNFTTRVAPGGDLTEKELMIYSWNDSTWDEYDVTWNSYTDWLFFSCNEQDSWTYRMSSSTTEKGKMCYYHRGSQPANVARMYSATGDERYAHSFLRHMSHLLYYVGVSSKYMNALDMSNHIANVGAPFIRCWDSKYMTPELFTAFLKHFSRMTDFIIVNYLDKDTHWNNWASNQTGSTYWACMMFPEFAQADYWYEKTLFHNKKLFKTFTFEDGVCIEQGLGYINTILGTINRAIEVYTDMSENPPYGIFMDEEGSAMILNIVKNMYYSLAPGYGGFDLSDSMDYGVSYQGKIRTWYKKLVGLGIDDEELKYVYYYGKKGKLPDFTSISFPYANRTYMRTSWDADAVAMAITAKGDGASHRHNDNLSVSMYGYGQYLLIDSSYGAVLTGDTRAYMAAPQRHNTLTINGGSQVGGKGYDSITKEVEISDRHNYVTYSNAHFENAKNVERTVMFPKDEKFFIITDYVEPSDQTKVNEVEQHWHMHPSANMSITDDGKMELRSNFESGANVIVAPVGAESYAGLSLQDSLYAPDYGTFIENKSGMYVKETYGPISFGTIIFPVMDGENKIIDTTPIDTGIRDNGAIAFEIKVTDSHTNDVEKYYYYHLNKLESRAKVNIGGYSVNATTLLVKEDDFGNVESMFIYDGYSVDKDGVSLFSSDKLTTISVDYSVDGMIMLDSENMDEKTLEGISVYSKKTGCKVTLNDTIVKGVEKNNSVIFGEFDVVNPDMNNEKLILRWNGQSSISSSGGISSHYVDEIYKKTVAGASFSPMSLYSSGGVKATAHTDVDGIKYISTMYGGYKHNAYKKDSSGNFMTGGELYSYITSVDGENVVDSTVPVLSFKVVMRVPEDALKTIERQVVLSFIEGGAVNLYCEQNADDGKLGISAMYSGQISNVTTAPYEYEAGKWATIETRMYRKADGNLLIGVYADDKQIYYGETTDSLYKTSMQVNTVELYNGRKTPGATDYKEISISAIDELYVPVNTIYENESKLIYFPFNNVSYSVPFNMEKIAYSTGEDAGAFMLDRVSDMGSKATYSTVDDKIVANDIRSLFVSTNTDGSTEQSLKLFADSDVALNQLVEKDGETVFKASYDVYIPSESASSVRSASLKITADDGKAFTMDSVINNGKLSFDTNNTSDVISEVPLTMRRRDAVVSYDEWHKVEYVLKVTPDSSGYIMKIYGILDNVLYYVNECSLKTDDIVVSSFPEFKIYGTGKGLQNIKTGYDNIGLAKMFNYTDSFAYGFDGDYIYPLYVGFENGVVKAKARIVGNNENLSLILAIYNADDKAEKIYTTTTFDGEYLLCESRVDDIIIKSGYKAKAFLFDNSKNIKPCAENAFIIVE